MTAVARAQAVIVLRIRAMIQKQHLLLDLSGPPLLKEAQIKDIGVEDGQIVSTHDFTPRSTSL
jgi:hypothetical protein